jgi:SAM-dependent methyltransferase
MDGEGRAYLCEMCGAEVEIIKKPVRDPKCPTLICCGKPMTAKEAAGVTTEEDVKDIVKSRYNACAERGGGEGAVCCPGETSASPSFAAEHGLYSREELSLVPETAFFLSRGCGNPAGFADLRPGEVVVDFGCGAGIDVVLAAHKVGPTGKVVGVDFAPHMIERAKQTVAEANVTETTEFVVADLERVELPDGLADGVISNCVINLSPDKEAVYREIFRVLKPGGRLAISDIVYGGKIDPRVRERFRSSWAGCVGGAIEEDRYFQILQDVGFAHVEIVARHPLEAKELEEMACCPGPEFTPAPAKEDIASVEGKVVSIKFRARKPRTHSLGAPVEEQRHKEADD